MAVNVTIWHNPRCSKSRETLALIEAHGIQPEIRLYIDAPPSLTELVEALARLKLPARCLARTSEPDFRALNLPADADDMTILAALARHPTLIERPLVMANGKAAICRPTESVLAIL